MTVLSTCQFLIRPLFSQRHACLALLPLGETVSVTILFHPKPLEVGVPWNPLFHLLLLCTCPRQSQAKPGSFNYHILKTFFHSFFVHSFNKYVLGPHCVASCPGDSRGSKQIYRWPSTYNFLSLGCCRSDTHSVKTIL